MKTQVAVIGGGPAGLLLSEILYHHGIDSIVLEKRSRDYVLSRVRAGVLEQNSVETLRSYGLHAHLEKGQPHTGFKIVWNKNQDLFIDTVKYTNKSLMIYGQSQLQEDLFQAADKRNAFILTEVTDVRLRDVNTEHPFILFNHQGEKQRINCHFIAGCDGFHGISRQSIPAHVLKTYEKSYPFCWLGILAAVPPLTTITYAHNSRGFALASARNASLSRYYIQVPLHTNIKNWSDNRFWEELKARYPNEIAQAIITGPSLEKSIAPLRISIVKKMHYGRLFLAGDAAHILPPTGAKGLNLAISDVFYLGRALSYYYAQGRSSLLHNYSAISLHRVRHALKIANYMTRLLHQFPNDNEFTQKIQESQLSYLKSSFEAQACLAKQYAGLDNPKFDLE